MLLQVGHHHESFFVQSWQLIEWGRKKNREALWNVLDATNALISKWPLFSSSSNHLVKKKKFLAKKALNRMYY